MGQWKLQLAAILCCFSHSVIAQSDMIPDPVNFESIPPDREELLEHFQLVLRALDALSVKVDRRVGDLDAKVSSKLSVIEGTLSGLDSKVEAINVKLEHVNWMVKATEAIKNDTGETLQKISVIQNVVVRTGSVVRNLSLEVGMLKDQLEHMTTTTTATPSEDGDSGSDVVGNDRRGEIIGSVLNRMSGLVYTGANFTGTSCHGLSLAFYPGSDNSQHLLRSYFTTIHSLGPCADNEFEFSTISNSSSETITLRKNKLKDIPDIARLGSYYDYDSHSNTKSVSSTTNPVRKYFIDGINRIKYFRAEIYERHLKQTPEVSRMTNSSVWGALEKKEGDDLGFIIPLSMSGPGNVSYNVFPQSKRNEFDWAKAVERIRMFVAGSSSNYVVVIVNFAYPDEVTNRPHGFYYWLNMVQNDMKQKIRYGFVRNE